jgi:putative transposase
LELRRTVKKSRFTEEQIVRILNEVNAGRAVREVCAAHGVSDATFYTWKRKYAGMETDDVRRLRELERENDDLKRLLAERDLEVSAARKLIRKNGWALPSELRERNF